MMIVMMIVMMTVGMVVKVHGGGWRNGSKRDEARNAKALAATSPFIVFVIVRSTFVSLS